MTIPLHSFQGFTYNSGSGAGVGEDTGSRGTSAACPVVQDLYVLEHNRDWTYKEIKRWIRSLDVPRWFQTSKHRN